MGETKDTGEPIAKCPNCGEPFSIVPGSTDMPPTCPQCQSSSPSKPVSAAVETRAASASGVVCPICQSPFADPLATASCPACQTLYHAECWEFNGGCGVYGCSQVPETQHRDSLEIPAGYWGQQEKPCPVCSRMILAAALRCRHCGAIFASVRPEDSGAFRLRTEMERKLPAVQRAGYWVMVLGIVPCSAPLTAVFGSIWYFRNRSAINALPGAQRAICKLGLMVAIGQTALMIVFSIVYALAKAVSAGRYS